MTVFNFNGILYKDGAETGKPGSLKIDSESVSAYDQYALGTETLVTMQDGTQYVLYVEWVEFADLMNPLAEAAHDDST